MTKKILFISSLYSPNIGGGAEIIMKEQIEGLSKKGYDCIVLTTKESGAISIDVVDGIKIYRVAIRNTYWHFNREEKNNLEKLRWHYKDRYNNDMKKYISHVIEIENPNIVICHNLSGWSISVWDEIKKYKLPIMQVLHDMYLLCIKSTMFNGKESCKQQCFLCKRFRQGFPHKSNNVDTVIGVSQFILDKFISYKYFNQSKKKVIYNRRNIDMPKQINTWDGKRTLVYGFIGTLAHNKGVEFLLSSFSQTDINATLLIAGEGDNKYETELKRIAQNDCRVQFIGYVEPSVFFSKVDITIVPSLWEEIFGLVAIESCAYNVPVIATRQGGLREIILEDINGLLIDIDESSLKEALLYYYNNVEIVNKHKRECRKSIESFLDHERMVEDYHELILGLLQ